MPAPADYIDVAQRIADFKAKHPDGCLRPADITYRAAPLKGTGTVAGQSVVHLDLPRLAVPARALREDRAGLPR